MNNALLTLLSISLSGSVLALLLFAMKPFIRNRVTKAFSYYIWLLVLLRLVLPFGYGINLADYVPASVTDGITSISPDNGSGYYTPDNGQSPIAPVDANTPAENINGTNTDGVNNLPATDEAPVVTANPVKNFDLLALLKDNLAAIWIAGMLISICWYASAYMVFKRRIYRSCIAPHTADIAIFEELCGEKNVRFAYSSYLSTPTLIGVFKPVIIVPGLAYKENGMETELRNILQHELMHYRRHDTSYKWFTVLVNSVHWFNPLAYLISREISRACELSCDEAVIREMSPSQRQSYGNTLLALAAKRRLPIGIMATTFCEEKRHLKGRLLSIKGYKKKSNLAIALMLALTLLLAGCASVYAAVEFGSNQNNDNIENSYKLEDLDENETELLALSVKGVYEDDFGTAPDDFASSFETIIAEQVIPDARKGESAPDIRAGYEAWKDSPIIFLGSIPEENIYLYGYNDAEFGLILDVGEEQTIYAFPYRYMSIQSIAPELGISSDGSEIYVACRIQSGTGVSIYELYVFPIDNISGAYRLNTNDLVESLNSKIDMVYNSETEMVSVYWAGQKIAESGLSVIGVSADAEIIPESFFCGNQIHYELEGGMVKLIYSPTIQIQEFPGAQGYLADVPYFEATVTFDYDNKTITEFILNENGVPNPVKGIYIGEYSAISSGFELYPGLWGAIEMSTVPASDISEVLAEAKSGDMRMFFYRDGFDDIYGAYESGGEIIRLFQTFDNLQQFGYQNGYNIYLFENVLGYNGFVMQYLMGASYAAYDYYAQIDGVPELIASVTNCPYEADLNNDGVQELISETQGVFSEVKIYSSNDNKIGCINLNNILKNGLGIQSLFVYYNEDLVAFEVYLLDEDGVESALPSYLVYYESDSLVVYAVE